VSLIETALEKLRRSESEGVPSPSAKRAAGTVQGPVQAPVVIAAAPVLQVPTKHLTLNSDALREAGYLPEEPLQRRFADHYRQIKRPLVEKAMTGGSEMGLILVTSALPGDGKTFTSLNLALSMARERDVSVLLVDADTPRANISRVLGIRKEPGLLDALSDESLDVESLVMRTDIRGLDVLPAGHPVENATELLASARMKEIAVRIGASHPKRLVVLDSAPLLVSSEARVLTRIPGQIVLVVRSGSTPQRAVQEAVALLDKQKLRGLIVNRAQVRQGGAYYGYSEYDNSGDDASTAG
jgi:exopolysaccharide/PEP-CTERM locus tyrosine autokinase